MSDYLPLADESLATWTANFMGHIVPDAVDYGLTPAQAAAYATKQQAYQAALTAALNPTTRGPATILVKNEAKQELIAATREIAMQIQGTMSVTNEQRQGLGLTVRKTPTPVPPPDAAPKIDIESISGRTVTIRLHDGDVAKRGKPPGVAGASVFSYVGTTPPADPSGWTFQGNTTRTTFTASFNSGTAAETVWFTAFWFNPRGMSGPGTLPPVQANLPAAASLPQTVQLKVAA